MKRTGVAFVLSLALSLPASRLLSQSAAAKRAPELDHITVHVRDLQKSSDFYEKVMRLEKIPDPFKDKKHNWYRMGPHDQLHVVSGATEPAPHEIDVHFAFRVDSVPDFMAHLDQMHVKYQNFNGDGKITVRPDGVNQIYLQDPDGYWIEVNDDKF